MSARATTTAYERLLDALHEHGSTVRANGTSAMAQCPAHEDRDPSLSLRRIEGSVLVHCHGTCSTDDVLAALGLAARDLYDDPAGASYAYTDRAGATLRSVHRSPDKRFRQSGDTRGAATLYRLPRVVEAVTAGTTVYVVEGEKDVHALESVGAVATTSPMGAGKWHKVDATPLHGGHVVVVADRDDAGRRHAAAVLGSLTGKAGSLTLVLPKAGKDAADHVAAGHGLGELVPAELPDDDAEAAEMDAAAAFARAVDGAAYDLRVREAARRKVATERSGDVDRPHAVSLRDFLAEPDPAVTYRVDRLWPAGGRIVLAAQWKAGKSTAVGNLLRSLADGTPFLDHFATGSVPRIALLDDELDTGTLRRWLRAHQVGNADAVRLVSLRGRVATLDLLDPDVRREWAAELAGADVIILDCLRPVLDALGLDESRDAGRFLVGFDALLRDVRADAAGPEAAEGMVVHHHGHTGERSRGDSRILDWPDATWKLVRADPEDPASPRYLSAYGRDVDVSEGRLTFDEPTRRLSFAGGNRRDSAAEAALPDVLDLLAGQLPDGLSQRQVEARMGDSEHTRSHVRDALKGAVDRGEVSRSPRVGRGGGYIYTASAPVRL